jgi:hypothetical protein
MAASCRLGLRSRARALTGQMRLPAREPLDVQRSQLYIPNIRRTGRWHLLG